jgi:sulfoxide reductase heme-binding subunit YedZ
MDKLRKNWLRILTHVGALTPLAWLLWDFWFDNLTVNPIQDITFRTGKPALILLVLSLACTPVSTVFGFKQVLPLRKPLGLYAFMYVCLHFLTFIGLDYGFDLGLLYEAIFEKRYALVGFAAFLILLPLAITSTQGWMRRLGKNWKRLHRREPLLYGAAVGLLLILRLPALRRPIANFRSRFKKPRRPQTVADGV